MTQEYLMYIGWFVGYLEVSNERDKSMTSMGKL